MGPSNSMERPLLPDKGLWTRTVDLKEEVEDWYYVPDIMRGLQSRGVDMVETRTNCRRHSGWVYLGAAIAFLLLLCEGDLLTLPYSRKHIIPSILSPLFDCLGLTGSAFAWGVAISMVVAIPLAGIAGFLLVVLAYRNFWGPIWLAWGTLLVPTALLGSILMGFAASLPVFTAWLPVAVAGGVVACGLLALGWRRGWRYLWLWWLIAWIGGFYAFFVILARVLAHFEIVHDLL
jgi:hypothetical protein